MSGPLPKFSAADPADAPALADADATALSGATDITAAAVSQWASYGFLGDDTAGVAAPAAALAPLVEFAPAVQQADASAAVEPAEAEVSPDAEPAAAAALDAAFGAIAGGRRLSGSPEGRAASQVGAVDCKMQPCANSICEQAGT